MAAAEALPLANMMEELFDMSCSFTHANSMLSVYFLPTKSSAV